MVLGFRNLVLAIVLIITVYKTHILLYTMKYNYRYNSRSNCRITSDHTFLIDSFQNTTRVYINITDRIYIIRF